VPQKEQTSSPGSALPPQTGHSIGGSGDPGAGIWTVACATESAGTSAAPSEEQNRSESEYVFEHSGQRFISDLPPVSQVPLFRIVVRRATQKHLWGKLDAGNAAPNSQRLLPVI
jgi:hypothetical protein